MQLKRLGVAILTCSFMLMPVLPAQAISKVEIASKQELVEHAVEFVSQNPDVYSDPATLDQYTHERMNLMGMQTEPSLATTEPGDVSMMCGSFCYEITDVHSVWLNTKTVDDEAFPIWEATVKADWGSGGNSGTWSATWTKSTSSSWNVNGSITAEAKVPFMTKVEATVGIGYSRTTQTSWSGTTNVNYSIPQGTKQTLYAYEKGTYWTFDCDCTIRMSDGYHRVTLSNAASGREAYPYQATTFRKGPILSL